MSQYLKDYKRIARKLTMASMQAEEDHEAFFSMEDLISDGRFSQHSDYFMGLISKQGMMNIIDAFHVTEELHKLSLDNISLDIDTSDPYIHRLYIYSGSHIPDNVICELVLHKGPIREISQFSPFIKKLNPSILNIEWLLLQNPKAEFTRQRRRLPGQSRPGLGMGAELMQLMVLLAKRLNMDGLSCIPRFFHTAYIFSKVYRFVSPEQQGIMDALSRDLLKSNSVHTVAWAANFNCILDCSTNQILDWQPGHLLYPLNRKLEHYFSSKDYENQYHQSLNRACYKIDQETFRQKITEYDIQIDTDQIS